MKREHQTTCSTMRREALQQGAAWLLTGGAYLDSHVSPTSIKFENPEVGA
jgi:hypothetical protein